MEAQKIPMFKSEGVRMSWTYLTVVRIEKLAFRLAMENLAIRLDVNWDDILKRIRKIYLTKREGERLTKWRLKELDAELLGKKQAINGTASLDKKANKNTSPPGKKQAIDGIAAPEEEAGNNSTAPWDEKARIDQTSEGSASCDGKAGNGTGPPGKKLANDNDWDGYKGAALKRRRHFVVGILAIGIPAAVVGAVFVGTRDGNLLAACATFTASIALSSLLLQSVPGLVPEYAVRKKHYIGQDAV